MHSIMIGILLISAFLLTWFISRWKLFIGFAALALVAMVGAIVAEQMIVTDREQLRQDVFDLAAAVQSNDVQGVVRFVSPQSPHTIRRVQAEMPDYDFRKCRVIGFNTIELPEGSTTRATVDFVVGFDVDATRTLDYNGSGTRRVTLTFEKQGDSWKITNYQHDHPQSRRYIKL
ncbi:MAG: hypothetical protein MK108_12955 [Mariniblastus sp.]|nr:hypothetical protein [Mariniblastus sp.]